MFEIAPATVERDAPVEADDLGSGLVHRGKQRGAIGAKINNWRAGFLQTLNQAADVRQNVAAIIFYAQAADPAVKNLDDIGSGTHLRGGIFGGNVDQLAHQLIPVSGRVVHHLLGVEIMTRAAAFDHVTRKSEGRSAETDDGDFVGEMFRNQAHGFGDISELGGAVGAKLGDIFLTADGLLDDWAFSRGEMKRQAHDFERKQEVSKDDAASTPRNSAAVMVTSAASSGFLQISSRECCLRTARYSGM